MTGIRAIRLVTNDADRLAGFYTQALGFRLDDPAPLPDDPFCGSLRRLRALSLGKDRIELIEPNTRVGTSDVVVANDTRFQHFALVAPDIDRAYTRLQASRGWTAITQGGPQHLPASSGGVTAFKFRDPDGHPLELLCFSDDAVPRRWANRSIGENGVLLGIDHTAIVVSDTKQSLSHYAKLGFERLGGSVNTGPAQAALDGLAAPHVEVTALSTGAVGQPHLELLCYGGDTRHSTTGDADVLATRIVESKGSTALRDPDGHRWIGGSGRDRDMIFERTLHG